MMHERLVLLRELLAEDGSIYVHFDWHVGHYAKIIMDDIFGKENFRNEVVWQKLTSPKAQTLGFGNVHDVILWFSKGPEIIFNESRVAHKEDYLEKMYRFVDQKTGRRYRLHDFTQKGKGEPRKFGDRVLSPPSGKHWIWSQEKIDEALKDGLIVFSKTGLPQIKRYLDDVRGQRLHDIWNDVNPIGSVAQERLDYETQKPEALLDRIIRSSSNEGDLVADFFCGSGTTLAVAEKLGRRWIGADLSKWAIQVTRKRLLQIDGCRPFDLLNLGNYERHKLAANGHDAWERYVRFILDLYRAEPITGFKMLHAKKARAYVHVGSVDSPVTMREIRETLKEAKGMQGQAPGGTGFQPVKSTGQRPVPPSEIHFLGWDFEMGLHDLVNEVGDDYGAQIRLVSIPKEALEVTNPAKEEVRFFDLNYLALDHEVKGKSLTVRLRDFNIANPEYIPDEVKEKIKRFTDYIDYWAVDWDYKEDTFHNQWQSFRTRPAKAGLETAARYTYDRAGAHKVLVKVVDIFGNDTTKLLEVKIR